jgi:hypothetical protein
MRARRGLAALAALLLLAACSSGDSPEPASQAAQERAEPAEPEVCPLTGEDPPRGVDLDRPAVAVKIENSREARPQSGLESADLVYEEIVEGGITRFMAFYHCGDSDRAGPVRSARFDDPKIARPITRVLGFSGANGIVERELDHKKMVALNELNTSNNAFFRVPPGNLDIHSLFVDISKLRAAASDAKLDAPREQFRFGALSRAAKRARAAVLHFNASNEITYRYRGGMWKRWEGGEPFRTRAGRQIAVPNVLIQQVEVNNSKAIFDPAGNPSPDIALKGSGKAWLLREGKVLRGRWRIAKDAAASTFTTGQGDRFTFAVGPIWVELVPSPKGDVKGSVAIK